MMKNNEYLVSVIVPIYNADRYLTQCIDSIINQSHKNLEIVLVNDGSWDKSGNIADWYSKKDNRIKVLHNNINTGVSSARNIGIDAAKGDYICFSDADDKVECDYVAYLLRLAVENDADISYTSEIFTTFYKKQTSKDQISVYTPEEATTAILCYKVSIGVYCKMFRRDFLNRYNIRFIPQIFIGEGFNFNTACFQRANKVVAGRKKIYFYRRDNPESAMTKFDIKKCEMAIYAIDRIKKDLIIRGKKVLKAWEFANWHTHNDMLCLIEHANAYKQYPFIYKKCERLARQKAYVAFVVPTKTIERIRAIIVLISPKLFAKLIFWRNQKLS